jgi:hypothetical protein
MNGVAREYMRRDEAADYVRQRWGIPCSRGLLAKLAVTGAGPLFRSAGRFPLYTEQDLDAWARARIGAPKRSTSDTSAAVHAA